MEQKKLLEQLIVNSCFEIKSKSKNSLQYKIVQVSETKIKAFHKKKQINVSLEIKFLEKSYKEKKLKFIKEFKHNIKRKKTN